MPLTLPLALLIACTPGSSEDEITVLLSDAIPTVVLVSWPAEDAATEAWVTFGPGDAMDWTAPAVRVDDSWTATLVGMKADSTGTLQPVERVDGEEHAHDELSFETGSVSSALPALSLTVDEAGRWDEGFLVTTLVTNPAAAIIIDSDGDVIWRLSAPLGGAFGYAELVPGVGATPAR